MKKRCIASGLVAMAALSGFTTDLFVGNRESVVKDVSANTVETSTRTVIGAGGCVRKTGGGTWQLPAGSIATSPTLALEVQGGTLEVGAAGTVSGAVEPPTAILNRALFWLDASDSNADHFKTEENAEGKEYVVKWHDVRETDVSAPTRMYAEANLAHSSTRPEKLSYEFEGSTRPTIWFGGVTSGRTMNWCNSDGGLYGSRSIRHLFGVIGNVESYGFVFGLNASSSTNPDFHPGAYGKRAITGKYLTNSAANVPYCGSFYLNGEWKDPFTTDVQGGWQLIEFDCHKGAALVNDFFNDRNLHADWCGYRAGGDYISEVLVFTESLTQSERLQVEQYLIDKWRLTRPLRTAGSLSIAEGATLKVVGTETPNVEIGGCGIYENAFDGVGMSVTVANTPVFAFSPLIRADLGLVELGRAGLVCAKAGDVLSATPSPSGAWVSTPQEAGPGELAKVGIEPVRIPSVPSDVTKLSVREGSLVVGALARDEAVLPDERGVAVTVQNASFEKVNGSETSGDEDILTSAGVSTKVDGWTIEVGSGSGAYLVDHIGGWKKNPGTYWEVDIPPVDGRKSLLLKAMASAYTSIDISTPGVYELSFVSASRQTFGGFGHQLELLLIDANQKTNVFGASIQPYYQKRFTEQRHLVEIPTAGVYTLGFRAVRPEDRSTLIDRVALHKVSEITSNAWRIPGGGLEAADFAWGDKAFMAFSAQNTHPNWTLTQPNGTSADAPAVGLSTWWMGADNPGYDGGAYFCDSGNASGSSVQLCFPQNDGVASTTFTPPAGTYRLRCKLARRNQYWPVLTASVVVGDSEQIDLGQLCPQKYLLETYEFPNSFSVAEGQSVTLSVTRPSSIANNTSGATKIVADDFELVRFLATGIKKEPAGNLIRNWSFESGNGNNTVTATADNWLFAGNGAQESDGSSFRGNYGWYVEHYGTDKLDGSYYMLISKTGKVEQVVTFPEAGAYQLRYFTHSRIETMYGTSYYNNWIRAYLRDEQGSETELAWAPGNSTNFVERTSIFWVPKPGAYNLGFQGLSGSQRQPGTDGRQALLDGVSVVKVDDALLSLPSLPEDLDVEVKAGATLQLDYVGTKRVRSVRLAGRNRSGVIDAKRFPSLINGCGSLYVEPLGLLLIVR